MKEVEPTMNLDSPATARELSQEFYHVYSIESKSQTGLYLRLAKLVVELEKKYPDIHVESLNPGFYVEDNMGMHTLLVTVAH